MHTHFLQMEEMERYRELFAINVILKIDFSKTILAGKQ